MTASSISTLPQRLRAALVMAGFTYDGVAEVLGTAAHEALSRNETTPALRRTTGGFPVETLIRLFLLQTPVALDAAERALPGPGRPAGRGGLPGADRRRGRRAPRCASVRRRRRPPLGRQRPDARPGRGAQPGQRRPRARDQLRLDLAGPAHPARAGRPLARPRHRVRRPGPAPRRPQRRRGRHRRQPARAADRRGSTWRSTTCRRPSRSATGRSSSRSPASGST